MVSTTWGWKINQSARQWNHLVIKFIIKLNYDKENENFHSFSVSSQIYEIISWGNLFGHNYIIRLYFQRMRRIKNNLIFLRKKKSFIYLNLPLEKIVILQQIKSYQGKYSSKHRHIDIYTFLQN